MLGLRPHHLLCILTYIGKGYDAEFTDNFTRVMERINAGERDIAIVKGPDCLCEPVKHKPVVSHDCYSGSISRRDDLALRDIAGLTGRTLDYGMDITLDEGLIGRLRAAFAGGAIRAACQACEWHDLCTEIAGCGFENTRLKGAVQ